jgi:hypothetical protein
MTGHAWLDAVLAIAVGMLVFWLLLCRHARAEPTSRADAAGGAAALPDLVRLHLGAASARLSAIACNRW